MKASVSQVVSVLILLVFTGCRHTASTAVEAGEAAVRTDQAEYVALHVPGVGRIDRDEHHRFTVIASYENRTEAPIYLEQCGGIVYHVWAVDPGEAESAYNRVWQCPGMEPMAVSPGQVRVDTIELQGPNMYDGIRGERVGSLEGRFRLVYEAGTCPAVYRCRLPVEERRSNSFLVRTRRSQE